MTYIMCALERREAKVSRLREAKVPPVQPTAQGANTALPMREQRNFLEMVHPASIYLFSFQNLWVERESIV